MVFIRFYGFSLISIILIQWLPIPPYMKNEDFSPLILVKDGTDRGSGNTIPFSFITTPIWSRSKVEIKWYFQYLNSNIFWSQLPIWKKLSHLKISYLTFFLKNINVCNMIYDFMILKHPSDQKMLFWTFYLKPCLNNTEEVVDNLDSNISKSKFWN